MAFPNTGPRPRYGSYPAPVGNPGMRNPQNFYGPPRFNNRCPWKPPPERHNFNIHSFMIPPHVVQQPNFPSNSFGQETSSGPIENFPFSNKQSSHGQQNGGQHFQHHAGRGRGFVRGHQRGHGFRGGFRGGFNNKQPDYANKPKKQKVDKRDLPENNVYCCEICDRGFKSADKYQEHVDGHIKCSFKDCPFIAAPKLVHLHMSMQHRSGIAKKVWSMESEEDIKKWRDERKRNYPTASNLAKKVQEKEDKVARGEVLETKECGKMWRGRGRHRGRGGRGHDKGRGRGHGRGRGTWRNHHEVATNGSEPNAGADSDSDSPPEEISIQKSTAAEEDVDSIEIENKSSGKATATALTTEVTTTEVTSTAQNTKIVQQVPSPHKQPACMPSEANSLTLLASYGDSSSDGEVCDEDKPEDYVGETSVPRHSGRYSPFSEVMGTLNPPLSCTPQKLAEDSQNPRAPISSPSSSVTTPSSEFQREAVLNGITSPWNESSNICSPQTMTPGAAATSSPGNDNTSRNSGSSNHNKFQNHNRGKGAPSAEKLNNQKGKEAAGSKRGPLSEQEGCPQAKKKKKEKTNQQLRKYTLLEKLLAPDIKRERNKILQCVHYIVKNKFFKRLSVSQAVPDTELASRTLVSPNVLKPM